MKEEQRLSDERIRDLQTQFLSKKLKIVKDDGDTWTGVCNFFGYNSYCPSWGLQATLGRTPITNIQLYQITVLNEDSSHI